MATSSCSEASAIESWMNYMGAVTTQVVEVLHFVAANLGCCSVRKLGRPGVSKAPRMQATLFLVLMWLAGVCMIGPPFMFPHLWSDGVEAAVLQEAFRLASKRG
eukprot:1097586-Prorocentrum_lima.AAC.1